MSNSNNSSSSSSKGIGFIGLLTIAFIVLKLCKIITWSWVWVLAPLWISLIVGVVCLIILIIILGLNKRW